MQTLDHIRAFEENWDGHGSPAPSAKTIACAEETLARIQFEAFAQGLTWQEPVFSANERGQVTLEWWQGNVR